MIGNSKLYLNANYHFPQLNEVCQVTEGRKIQAQVSPIEINCYPNPSNGLFTLSFPENKDKKDVTYDVEIRNSLGRLCYKSLLANPPLSEEINLTSSSTGIYYLVVKERAETVLHKKLIILK